MIPAYQIVADSHDVTAAMQKYLTSLRIIDKAGVEADECEIELADPDGTLNLPARGVVLSVSIGWQGNLTNKGSFTVDEVSESGPPDHITVTARSADFQGTFKVQREQSYTGKTIGDILTTIAKRNDLKPAIEEGLARILIDHIDQTNESDPNFLTRLGTDYDAIATIKAGHLLFIPKGHDKTVGGILLPPVSITRGDGDRHSFQIADRDGTTTGVRAKWRDKSSNQFQYSTAGTGENWITLKREFPNAVTAWHAAKAEWARLQRGKHTISLTLANGDPNILACRRLLLSGWRPEINAIDWMAGDVTHELNDGGFTTSLTAKENANDL